MDLSIAELGFKRGAVSECIVTTYNEEKNPNAAPIGIYFLNNTTLVMKIYENRTVKNMLMNEECAINIVDDAFIFLKCIAGYRDFEYLEAKNINAPVLKNARAVIECKVDSYKEYLKEDKYGKSRVFLFKIKVVNCYLLNNKNLPKVLNRGENAVLEIAVKLSRRDYNIERELKIAKRCLAYEDYKKLISLIKPFNII